METIICPECHALSEVQVQRLGTLIRCSRCRATIVAAKEIPTKESNELAMVDRDEDELATVDYGPPLGRRRPLGSFILAATLVRHHANNPKAQEAQKQHPPNAADTPEKDGIKIEASDLMASYRENEVEADRLFKGQWLIVHGLVVKVGKDALDNRYVLLHGKNGQGFTVFDVQCFFDRKHDDDLANLSPGDWQRIRGKGAGKMGNTLVKQCELLKEKLPDWVEEPEILHDGDMEWSVQDARVATATILTPVPQRDLQGKVWAVDFKKSPSPNRLLMVKVVIRNGGLKPFLYRPTAVRGIQLQDDKGNVFMHYNSDRRQYIEGQCHDSIEIVPGQWINDLFLFTPPALGPGEAVFLKLIADAPGGPSVTKIRIRQIDIARRSGP